MEKYFLKKSSPRLGPLVEFRILTSKGDWIPRNVSHQDQNKIEILGPEILKILGPGGKRTNIHEKTNQDLGTDCTRTNESQDIFDRTGPTDFRIHGLGTGCYFSLMIKA